MIADLGLDHYEDAALLVLLDHRQRATRRLQQRTQLSFNKPHLLVWIAHVAQRRTHVKRAARLTLEKHVVTAQVNLRGFTRSAQLFEVTVAEFSLFVLLVADGLRVDDPLGNGGRLGGCHSKAHCTRLVNVMLNPCCKS